MNKTKRPYIQTILALNIITTILGISTTSVSAHVSKTDGAISAELHIPPEDKPVSGETTAYTVEFYDTANLFTLARCDCRINLLQNGATIQTTPLADNDLLVSENTIIFPKAGTYIVEINGTPKEPGVFQSFSLDYPITVTAPIAKQQPVTNQSLPISFWIWLSVGAVSMGLITYASLRGKRIKIPKSSEREDQIL